MPSTFVPPSGKLDAQFVIIGEQPGKQEVLRHQPFVGPAGENLNECLHAAEIMRSNCYLTNVIKDYDHPLKYYFPTLIGGRKEKIEISAAGYEYIAKLKDELSKTSANVIIPCGNVALYALTNRVGITNWRGSILESTLLPGRKVIPTLHPATYTQEKLYTEPENYLNKYLIILDLKKAARESYYPELFLTPRKLLTQPDYHDVLIYLQQCKTAAYNGNTLWFDIELTPKTQELSCISFAANDGECMCIPFVDSKGDYWDAEQEMVIMKCIADLLSDPEIKKGGQNVIFDAHFLLRKYGIRTVNLDDTMIAQRILYPEYRMGLNFITAMWTDIPYYKNDGKIWLEGTGEFKRGWEYNCYDSLSCASAFPAQFSELHERGNHHAYFSKRKIIEPFTYMMEHGLRVDLNGMKLARDTNAQQQEILAEKFKSIAGEDINVNSPKQLMEYFYVKRGVPSYSEEGKLTINIRALHHIKRSGHCAEECDILLQYRKLHKQSGTYLNLENVDADGRIRCSYNPVGTKYGRASSSKNIFGTGLNLQNVSPAMAEYLIADEGYIIYSLDLSQYENRIVAYVGQIPEMIQVFEKNLDSHRMTGSLIFNKPYDEVSDEPGSCSIGNGDASERDWAKRSNHAFNYGMGWRRMSQLYEIPGTEAKWLHSAYHKAYPRVEHGYWKHVQDSIRSTRSTKNLLGRQILFLMPWGDKMLHNAYSSIPQSTCADVIDSRGVAFTYYNEAPHFRTVELLTQIHDSIAFQVPFSTSVEDHAKIILDIKNSLETPLEWLSQKIQTPVDLVVSKNLNKFSMHSRKVKLSTLSVESLASKLKEVHMELK
jgi:uracil-DNA glycosylase family 4